MEQAVKVDLRARHSFGPSVRVRPRPGNGVRTTWGEEEEGLLGPCHVALNVDIVGNRSSATGIHNTDSPIVTPAVSLETL